MSKRDGKYWDESWNPVKDSRGGYHCTKCSPGCLHCWAEKINMLKYKTQPYDNTPVEYVLDEKVLNNNLIYGHKNNLILFVQDLSDLFHELVPFSMIDSVFSTMAAHEKNKYLVLTKRVKRMYEFVQEEPREQIWLGATVCNQEEVDDTLPVLQSTPAAHRWLSIEPLLERMRLADLRGIDWVTVGAESLGNGPGRECRWVWILDIVNYCRAWNVPVWVKQAHLNCELVRNIEQLPVDIRVREMPAEFSINNFTVF